MATTSLNIEYPCPLQRSDSVLQPVDKEWKLKVCLQNDPGPALPASRICARNSSSWKSTPVPAFHLHSTKHWVLILQWNLIGEQTSSVARYIGEACLATWYLLPRFAVHSQERLGAWEPLPQNVNRALGRRQIIQTLYSLVPMIHARLPHKLNELRLDLNHHGLWSGRLFQHQRTFLLLSDLQVLYLFSTAHTRYELHR